MSNPSASRQRPVRASRWQDLTTPEKVKELSLIGIAGGVNCFLIALKAKEAELNAAGSFLGTMGVIGLMRSFAKDWWISEDG